MHHRCSQTARSPEIKHWSFFTRYPSLPTPLEESVRLLEPKPSARISYQCPRERWPPLRPVGSSLIVAPAKARLSPNDSTCGYNFAIFQPSRPSALAPSRSTRRSAAQNKGNGQADYYQHTQDYERQSHGQEIISEPAQICTIGASFAQAERGVV